MFRGENIIGILLLALCAVVAFIMITAIVTGKQPSVPDGMSTPITIIGVGAILIVLWQRFGSRFRR